LAVNLSQAWSSVSIACCAEPGPLFFGARPYQLINVTAHQRTQGAGRRAAQADQFELLSSDAREALGEHADRESRVHSAALATDGHLF
jgi:hypothetical protein